MRFFTSSFAALISETRGVQILQARSKMPSLFKTRCKTHLYSSSDAVPTFSGLDRTGVGLIALCWNIFVGRIDATRGALCYSRGSCKGPKVYR